ncbi:hypothetical protein MP638_003838 [Amoeboaphelidium occidentale]|nr:hypothetical protein MP638_003838 [Amoeboaphelidium occidentale]
MQKKCSATPLLQLCLQNQKVINTLFLDHLELRDILTLMSVNTGICRIIKQWLRDSISSSGLVISGKDKGHGSVRFKLKEIMAGGEVIFEVASSQDAVSNRLTFDGTDTEAFYGGVGIPVHFSTESEDPIQLEVLSVFKGTELAYSDYMAVYYSITERCLDSKKRKTVTMLHTPPKYSLKKRKTRTSDRESIVDEIDKLLGISPQRDGLQLETSESTERDASAVIEICPSLVRCSISFLLPLLFKCKHEDTLKQGNTTVDYNADFDSFDFDDKENMLPSDLDNFPNTPPDVEVLFYKRINCTPSKKPLKLVPFYQRRLERILKLARKIKANAKDMDLINIATEQFKSLLLSKDDPTDKMIVKTLRNKF